MSGGAGAEVTLELLKKYDRPGPRYTSYPTAVEFNESYGEGDYREIGTVEEFEKYLKGLSSAAFLAVAIPGEQGGRDEDEEEEEEPQPEQTGFLPLQPEDEPGQSREALRPIAISLAPNSAAEISRADAVLAERVKRLLEDSSVLKAIHDWKAALHESEQEAVAVAGVRHDPMLYSYLLDPTYSSHALAEVALRKFNLKLSGNLAAAADVAGRLATVLRKEVEEQGLASVYEEIDAPLVPVLARMEDAGVKIDTAALGRMSEKLEREAEAKAPATKPSCTAMVSQARPAGASPSQKRAASSRAKKLRLPA